MSTCFRCGSSLRSCWRPRVLPSESENKNSLAEHFGITSRSDVANLAIEGDIIVREEDVASNRFALWELCNTPVPLSEQVPSYTGLEPHTIPSLVQYLFEEGWGERHFHEFIPEHSLQKLRFDLDIDEKLVQNEADRHTSAGFWIRVIFQMSEYLLRPYSPGYNPRWVICCSNGPTKTSYHIILSNYYFSNSHVCMELTRLIKGAVHNDLFRQMLDEGVCKPNSCFRILNCSKVNSTRVKRLVLKESFPELEYEIPREIYRKGDNVKPILHFYDELAATLITYTTGCDYIAYPAPAKLSQQAFIIPSDPVVLEAIEILQKQLPDYHFVLTESRPGVVKVAHDSGMTCPLCDRIHEKEQMFLQFRQDGGIQLKCFRAARGKGIVLRASSRSLTSLNSRMNPVNHISPVGGVQKVPQYNMKDPYYFCDFMDWASGRLFHAVPGETKGSVNIVKEEKDGFVALLSRCVRFIERNPLMTYIKASETKLADLTTGKYHHDAECEIEYVTYLQSGEPRSSKSRVKVAKIMLQCREVFSRDHIFELYHSDEIQINDPNLFNIFPGFDANLPHGIQAGEFRNEDYELVLPLLNHISKVYAGDNVEYFNWILTCLATPIRFKRKAGVALILIGSQGCGKSVFFAWERKFVYGNEIYFSYDDITRMFDSSFDSERNGRVRVHIEEFNGEGEGGNKNGLNPAMWNRFKSLVTDEFSSSHGKNKTKENVISMSTISGCGNQVEGDEKPIPIRLGKDDRRIGIFRCNPIYKGDQQYFKDLLSKINNRATGNAWYAFLRSDYIQQFLVENLENIPLTELRQSMMDTTTPRPEIFVREIFVEASIPLREVDLKVIQERVWVSSESLYRMYQEWCTHSGIERPWQKATFAKFVTKMNGITSHRLTTGKKPHGIIIEPFLFETVNVELKMSESDYMMAFSRTASSLEPEYQSLAIWFSKQQGK
jgi:hypothetical protein